MTLAQKFEEFNPEQKEQLLAVKSEAELDAFLAKTGKELSPEEKAEALEYIATGVAPLEDDDLEAVAGGKSGDDEQPPPEQTTEMSKQQAFADGRRVKIICNSNCILKQGCQAGHVWCESFSTAGGAHFWNAKCYKCGTEQGQGSILINATFEQH
ncbi:MAG: hypothetical protein FWH17_09485 [Oscillospiraceae bacterium]|nr:hypothetical protein [Oscillospiraceae bacterium]